MGSSSRGSNLCLMARYMNTNEISIITTFCQPRTARPDCAARSFMVSIKSENKRRQRIFKECKVNNINDYTRLFNSGSVNEPIPHLLIIIDEFAELKKAEPEFMQELISVAQVGRSLGVHLLLATQKPGGVVDDKIWSNSRFRICLKVQEREDSMDMLHNMDACQITQTGRGYLQVGNI